MLGCLFIPIALVFTFNAFISSNLGLLVPAFFFWLISAFPIYSWVIHSKRKILVNIDKQKINIEWRPKNTKKTKSYDRHDIDQLYVKRNPNWGYFEIYMVVNSENGQKHALLIPEISTLTKAKYLEQEIERHMGIIDREVIEEIK